MQALTSLALSGEHQAELMALLAGILHVSASRRRGENKYCDRFCTLQTHVESLRNFVSKTNLVELRV